MTQGSNPHLLHWQADSLPLSHQGSPQTLKPYVNNSELLSFSGAGLVFEGF